MKVEVTSTIDDGDFCKVAFEFIESIDKKDISEHRKIHIFQVCLHRIIARFDFNNSSSEDAYLVKEQIKLLQENLGSSCSFKLKKYLEAQKQQ